MRRRTFSALLMDIDNNFVVLSIFVVFHSYRPLSPSRQTRGCMLQGFSLPPHLRHSHLASAL